MLSVGLYDHGVLGGREGAVLHLRAELIAPAEPARLARAPRDPLADAEILINKMRILLVLILSSSLICVSSGSSNGSAACPKGLIVFGGSLSDTGNTGTLFPGTPGYPYGITYPGFSTGRYSDGRLIIDYIAHAYRFHLEPYFVDVNPDYKTGINFAEAGATALNTSFRTPFYFSLQVAQFLQFKQRVLSNYKEHGGRCGGSLPPQSFFTDFGYVIEFGRNDIGYHLYPTFGNKSVAEVRDTIVPQVVASIRSTLLLLHDEGARKFLVFGISPQGCMPQYKTIFGTSNPADYDSNQCLIPYNNISIVFNSQLKDAVDALRIQYTDSQFFFADLYNSYFEITNNAHEYGLTDVQNACCGTGAPYNYSPSRLCGTPGVPFCSNPSNFVSWDGRHYTQRYYQIQADLILTGKYLDPPSELLCLKKGLEVRSSGVNTSSSNDSWRRTSDVSSWIS